jgi:hypothetical protein
MISLKSLKMASNGSLTSGAAHGRREVPQDSEGNQPSSRPIGGRDGGIHRLSCKKDWYLQIYSGYSILIKPTALLN